MDILFFAAVALFIFFKLNKQLGKIDEEEKKNILDKIAKRREEILAAQAQMAQQNQQPRVVSPLAITDANPADEKILFALDSNTKQNFLSILQSCNISAEFFINGVKSSFEMILKAFSAADMEILKFLLSDKIYKGFEAAVNQRKSQENTLITNVIAVENAEIIAASLAGNMATVTVKIASKQINYISDKNSQIIEGRKDEISDLTDIWTFQKDITSPNPNWVVSATSNA